MSRQVFSVAGTVGGSVMAIDAAMGRVSRLDLGQVTRKLQATDPSRWTEEVARCLEGKYRRFLALHLVHRGEAFVPNELLDEYWHQHILDTRKYSADCHELFGEMLHHDPYFGMRNEQERRENQAGFERLCSLWELYFAEPLLGAANPCSSTDCR